MAKFKENANMFSIVDETKAPIIHGHTRIDLRDVKTGKRERIESDNTFMATTLAKYMRDLGFSCNSPYENQEWRSRNMVRNLCGGVFLFKDAIPDNAEYMQAGNKMTANGCYNIVNTGNPSEFGSWNSIESNIDGNSSAVLVWDWNTSQGNGQISSVCLTSEVGGYIGYGNASGYRMSALKQTYENQNSVGFGQGKFIYNNLRYRMSYTSPILTVEKYRAPVTKASIFDKKLKSTVTFDLSNIGLLTLPTGLTAVCIDDNKIMLRRNNNMNIADNSTIEFMVYDPSNDSLTVKTVVNTTGVTVELGRIVYFSEENLLFIELRTDPETIHVCNGTTGAIIKTFHPDTITPYFAKFTENLFGKDGYNNFIDMVNETCYPTNAVANVYDIGQYNKQSDCFFGNSVDPFIMDIGTSWAVRMWKNPLYLATINNLKDSVTKQNTQTMKVTYTLTEV